MKSPLLTKNQYLGRKPSDCRSKYIPPRPYKVGKRVTDFWYTTSLFGHVWQRPHHNQNGSYSLYFRTLVKSVPGALERVEFTWDVSKPQHFDRNNVYRSTVLFFHIFKFEHPTRFLFETAYRYRANGSRGHPDGRRYIDPE